MNLFKAIPLTLIVMATSVANAQSNYLTGNALQSAISGQTLLANNWAEYYSPDGTISGKARKVFVFDYTGRWTAYKNKICYEYPANPSSNTCSRLTLNNNTITHYTMSGELKEDGVAQRRSGNSLNEFK
jgi:hypothetical protein